MSAPRPPPPPFPLVNAFAGSEDDENGMLVCKAKGMIRKLFLSGKTHTLLTLVG